MAQAIVIPSTKNDIRFLLSVDLHIMHLRFEPVVGRRTFYASLKIGRHTFWVMRWDTARCTKETPFAFSSDRLMCWTAGSRRQS